MATPKYLSFDTLSLHAGQQPDPTTGARATPIYQSASFVFPDSDFAAGLFNIERAGHVYSRLSNPTNAVLEERIAALEGGIGALSVASGQAAMHLAITTILSAGDHIVASRSLYGGSHNLLEYTLPRFGIHTTFVNARNLEEVRAAIRPETRLVFGETLGNPGLDVLDVPRIADIAHEAGIPLLVDNTFATPYLFQPFAHGADLVFHSATKFLSGHGIVIGGLVVDSGQFDWDASGKFPTLTAPYEGFHDLVFTEEFGPAAFVNRARREGYPELASHPDHALAAALLPRGCGAVFSFELQGGREAGVRFIENLGIFSHLANVGDAKSLVIHPASTTHHRMDAAALQASGISEGLIRVSIGLEDSADLLSDLARALHASQRKR